MHLRLGKFSVAGRQYHYRREAFLYKSPKISMYLFKFQGSFIGTGSEYMNLSFFFLKSWKYQGIIARCIFSPFFLFPSLKTNLQRTWHKTKMTSPLSLSLSHPHRLIVSRNPFGEVMMTLATTTLIVVTSPMPSSVTHAHGITALPSDTLSICVLMWLR